MLGNRCGDRPALPYAAALHIGQTFESRVRLQPGGQRQRRNLQAIVRKPAAALMASWSISETRPR